MTGTRTAPSEHEATRAATQLADGRELIYFGARAATAASVPDRRTDLPRGSSSSQLRWDPLFEDIAVIAGHRQSRTYRPAGPDCPLCPSREGRLTEIPAGDYDVAVFENRFPAFAADAGGRCEVVCFSSDHERSFALLPAPHAVTVVDALADRTAALATAGAEYVLCFENRGAEIGVTLGHPHGQIYGYPYVPPRFARAGDAAHRYRARTARCLQCDQLADELRDTERIVVENEHWVAYVPYAARWPYEVRTVPRRHVPDLPALDVAGRRALAAIHQDVLRRFDTLFGEPAPYIAAWLQAPTRRHRDDWHLAGEVFTIRRAADKLKYLAGAESVAATWINDIAPETAAERLRG
ncbi:UDPglucose--hexose-1-phosphate uridylyltransferase [Jatrophihabitans endophyticus]|uniref:Galactose-1-phosphate uridylyltransferase n=1 Tax=Jatrophihabitans endophyticus TaxID=1206085 RepID=A0A1M5DH65_9ACTN|nr:galactose-1-phosphate uridylyltransferase [Jatrophihabitans endophyticus]SHF66052.1 UDPglucose--hexose-1-phosphate uridylyltransferase [Jatrophihabitans endophyticus]